MFLFLPPFLSLSNPFKKILIKIQPAFLSPNIVKQLESNLYCLLLHKYLHGLVDNTINQSTINRLVQSKEQELRKLRTISMKIMSSQEQPLYCIISACCSLCNWFININYPCDLHIFLIFNIMFFKYDVI